MASLKALCLAAVASLAVTATANAADLLPPPPPIYVPPPPPVVLSGVYLRGDVGEGNLELSHASSTFSPDYAYEVGDGSGNPTANGKPDGFSNTDYVASAQVTVGGGVGYQFNRFFRADVTGEFRFGSAYRALEGYNYQTFANGVASNTGFTAADRYSGSISNGLILANGYLDLGTWYRVTPYVGAGVGVAFNRMGAVTDYNVIGYNAPSGVSQANTRTSFAYAFMAGLSYALTDNLALDFGYRYVNMGRIQSGQIDCYGGSGTCGDNSREVQSYRLQAQDVRLGLRYTFANILPAPLPVIARY